MSIDIHIYSKMSTQFWLSHYFRKTNIFNNQYAILIYNKKKLSIERNNPSVLHVSPNVEDGSPIHCIKLEPTNRNPHKSIKGLQVQPIARKWLLIAFCLENPLSHCLALFPISFTIPDHRLNSRLQKKSA